MSVSSKFSRSHTKFHTKRVQHCLVTPRFACSMTILSGWMMNESPQALEVGKMKWMWSNKTWHQKIWKAALCNVYIIFQDVCVHYPPTLLQTSNCQTLRSLQFQVREVNLIDAAIADKTSRKQGCFGWQRSTLAADDATLLPKSGTCEINL